MNSRAVVFAILCFKILFSSSVWVIPANKNGNISSYVFFLPPHACSCLISLSGEEEKGFVWAMTGTITEDYGMSLRSSATEGMLSEQRCPSSDSITEWRSCEQVENGTPSTSPPYWDTDDDDDGSELSSPQFVVFLFL